MFGKSASRCMLESGAVKCMWMESRRSLRRVQQHPPPPHPRAARPAGALAKGNRNIPSVSEPNVTLAVQYEETAIACQERRWHTELDAEQTPSNRGGPRISIG